MNKGAREPLQGAGAIEGCAAGAGACAACSLQLCPLCSGTCSRCPPSRPLQASPDVGAHSWQELPTIEGPAVSTGSLTFTTVVVPFPCWPSLLAVGSFSGPVCLDCTSSPGLHHAQSPFAAPLSLSRPAQSLSLPSQPAQLPSSGENSWPCLRDTMHLGRGACLRATGRGPAAAATISVTPPQTCMGTFFSPMKDRLCKAAFLFLKNA